MIFTAFKKKFVRNQVRNHFSRTPVCPDPYESEFVVVRPSLQGEEAGEGLFAKKGIAAGTVAALFNGVNIVFFK